MTVIASSAGPPWAAPRTAEPGGRVGPTADALFEAAVDLLAASRAVAANADAPDAPDAVVGPALACIEGSLDALGDMAERMRENALASWPAVGAPHVLLLGDLDRLTDALRSASLACSGVRDATAAVSRMGDGG